MTARKPYRYLSMVLLALFLVPVSFAWAQETQEVSSGQQGSCVLVVLRDGTSFREVEDLALTPGIIGLKDVSGISADEVSSQDASGFALFQVNPSSSIAEVCSALLESPNVEIAQPDFSYCFPDDEPSETSLQRTLSSAAMSDPYRSRQYYLDSISAPAAWDLLSRAGVANSLPSIAVIDFSFNITHPDIAENVVASYDAVYGDTNVSVNMNRWPGEIDHGTSVAGVVSAVPNNGIGIAGTSNGAGLVCIKVFDERSNTYESTLTSDIIRAFQWLLNGGSDSPAKRYNVRVINMSLGGVASSYDSALERYISQARAQGIVTVCAAGNDTGSGVPYACYPGDLTNTVSVMALNDDNVLANFSNYNASFNDLKNIAAPGDQIYSLVNPSSTGYGSVSGTSFASPVVAAVMAMEFAADPSLSADEAIALLYDSATDLGSRGWDRWYGHGKVNAEAAVRKALPSAIPKTPTEPDPQPQSPATPTEPDPQPQSPATPTEPDPDPEPARGWVNLPDGGRRYIDQHGRFLTGWQFIEGSWFWFDGTGRMATYWVFEGGTWYFFDPGTGMMHKGWLKDSGKWYYFLSSGAMAKGWIHDGSYWYYFNSSGAMATGWLLERSTWYYLSSSGVMATGWRSIGGNYYLFDRTGAMMTGLVWVDGVLCRFADTGELLWRM